MVAGVVTVEPGRILGDRTIAIQDGSGAIYVRLPTGTPRADLVRGAIVEVAGVLASPYANLEIRPGSSSQITVVGSGGLPSAEPLISHQLGEATEGQLAQLEGKVSSVSASSTGSYTVFLEDGAGQARVFVHPPTGIARSRFEGGIHVRVVGLVGQRESSLGANDGYRLWPRDQGDMTVLADATPRPTPRSTELPRTKPTPPPDGSARVVRIRAVRPGETVTIEGTVTSPTGLIDSDTRRVTLEDGSGAILARFEVGDVPALGARVRISGKVGSWYGAPQIEATGETERLGRSKAMPTILRRPPGPADEWRLVRLTVRVVSVRRDGDSWRAEVSLGAGGELPVTGVSRSGIPADALVEGRSATIVGIVRRAYPTARDQRLALMPRSSRDIQLAAAPREDDAGTIADGSGTRDTPLLWVETDGSGPSGSTAVEGHDGPALAVGGASGETPFDASLAAMADLEGRLVRVGGRVTAVAAERLTLHDGSASGRVRLLPDAGSSMPVASVGDVLNVTGIVERAADGQHEVIARHRSDITRAALLSAHLDPVLPDPGLSGPGEIGETAEGAISEVDDAVDPSSGAEGVGPALRAALIGLVLLVLASACLVGLGLMARRARVRRRSDPRKTPPPGTL